MQKLKKFLSLALTLMIVFGAIAPVMAAEAEVKTNTVTLHKLLMSEDELEAWDSKAIEEKGYDGTQDREAIGVLAGKTLSEIPNVYFAWQKMDTDGTWKYIKADGTFVDPQPTTITKKAFDDAGVFGMLTTADGAAFTTSTLPQDAAGTEYRIVEVKQLSTYKNDDGSILADSKAVPVYITLPLVNESGAQTEIHIYPKNTEDKPEIDKNFAKENGLLNAETAAQIPGGADYLKYEAAKEKASAQIGTVVPYEVKTKVPAGTEYQKLTWNDTMTNGLTYQKDLVITVTPTDLTLDPATDYVLTQDDRGFTLALTKSGLEKVSGFTKPVDANGASTGAGVDVEFTLKYSAKVNSNAVTDVPDKNNITLEYGNNEDNEIEEKEVTPLNKELQVNKTWSEGTAPDGVYVTYTLKDAGAVVASVTLNGKETVGTKYTVGDGITFEVTGAYSGKFVGLEDGKTYTISERVGGYTPEYTESVAGSVSVMNNKDTEGPEPLDPTEPEVVTYGKKFVKTDSSAEPVRLAGAQFVVKNAEGKYLEVKTVAQTTADGKAYEEAEKAYQDAIVQYNAMTAEEQASQEGLDLKASIATLKADRDAKFLIAREEYNWVTPAAEPTEADPQGVLVLTSNELGQFEINGLAAGTYYLVEIKAPEGFAILKDPVEFTIGGGEDTTADNIKYELADAGNTALQVVNKKVTIPQTGGIGTVIFTVGGIALMGGAAVAMKKNKEEDAE
ncbi:MAG: pilin N-terminal domain-containing protein [Finegoldia sp.]|nr:pilin N-terminal domain-containing protein [Finegoldia sp.]